MPGPYLFAHLTVVIQLILDFLKLGKKKFADNNCRRDKDRGKFIVTIKTCNVKKRNEYFVFHILWNYENCNVSFAVQYIVVNNGRVTQPGTNIHVT